MQRRLFKAGDAVISNGRSFYTNQEEQVASGIDRNRTYHILGYYRPIVNGKRFVFITEIGKSRVMSSKASCLPNYCPMKRLPTC